MQTSRTILLLAVTGTLSAGICDAQFRFRGGRGFGGGDNGPIVQTEGGELVNEDTVRTARETAMHSADTPNWTNSVGFEKDVFTFARVIYKSGAGPRRWRPTWLNWINDYPDSDLDLSYRLQQMTSIKVDPDGRVLKLTDPALFNYPFIYIVKPGSLEFRDEEVPPLRKYLLNGGVLMFDDFWGTAEWENVESQMKRVLPERSWVELPMEHPLFHCVFDLNVPKNKLQVPSIHRWERNRDSGNQLYGNPFRDGEGPQDVHLRAWLDDKQRIMAIAAHNTDYGDGWEREGEDIDYFHIFSEKRAYPLGINIIFYVMTH